MKQIVHVFKLNGERKCCLFGRAPVRGERTTGGRMVVRIVPRRPVVSWIRLHEEEVEEEG